MVIRNLLQRRDQRNFEPGSKEARENSRRSREMVIRNLLQRRDQRNSEPGGQKSPGKVRAGAGKLFGRFVGRGFIPAGQPHGICKGLCGCKGRIYPARPRRRAGFPIGSPGELTRWPRAVRLLEHGPLREAKTISGDLRKVPGFLKGPAGTRAETTLQKSRSLRCKRSDARSEDDAILYVLRGRATQQRDTCSRWMRG